MPNKPSFPSIESFEDDIQDNTKTEEKKEQNNSKPALAKAAINTYGKYFVFAISLIGIIYKIVFNEPETLKKTNFKKTQKTTTSDTSSSIRKNIDVESKDSMMNVLRNELKIKNEKQVTVITPEIKIPEVPVLNDQIKQEELKRLEEEKIEKKRLEDEKIAEEERLKKLKPELQKPKLELENKKEMNSPSLNKPAVAVNNNKSGNGNFDDSMFIINTGGGSSKRNTNNNTRLAKGGSSDLIVLDSSSLFLKERSLDDELGNIRRVSNLANTITEGKIIEAVLETSINTEEEGSVRAIVSKDIFGEEGSNILIPKGSRLYGAYSSDISVGQSRVMIIWNKILRPDGVSVNISANVMDSAGRAGIEGSVDSRYFELIRNSALFSFITLGTAIAAEKVFNLSGQSQIVNNNGSVATTNITPGNAAAQSLIGTATEIAKQMATQFSGTVKPIIRINHGELLMVGVNQELKLPSYKRKEYNLM